MNPIYTYSTYPEVEKEEAINCLICSMALELKTASANADSEENIELRNMMRPFWIGAVLTLPVFILAMAQVIPVLSGHFWVVGNASRWIQPLSEAEIGVAMGTGTSVAMESAGITKDIYLSRATMRNIRENLFFAFLYYLSETCWVSLW